MASQISEMMSARVLLQRVLADVFIRFENPDFSPNELPNNMLIHYPLIINKIHFLPYKKQKTRTENRSRWN